MPIRPENMAKYPGGSIRSPEWLAIRERIHRRAGNRCEGCGVRNGAHGCRHPVTDEWLDYAHGKVAVFPQSGDFFGRTVKLVRIVCTVAHVDGKLDDHSDDNLRFWCQRCHNRHDAASRQENATITRHEKAGQLDLLGRK